MKITICGSMTFSKEMVDAKAQLEKMGHVCFMPYGTDDYISGRAVSGNGEGAQRKIEHDAIRRHYNLINGSDSILVLNLDKKGVKNYVGGNSFLEIGYAYVLGKKIFLLNDIPEIELIKEEIQAIKPIIINSDLAKII